MSKPNYDFAGWVTKNDLVCSDGVTIKHNAFKNQDGTKVPLTWNHNSTDPKDVLGNIVLKHHDTGVYGYGYFNTTERAKDAKELLRHGDITSMSIGARKIKRDGSNVIHGIIYEVSLVLAGANPGALIDTVINHSEDGDTESGVIYTGNLIHSADDIILDDQNKDSEGETMETNKEANKEKTVGDVLDTLNEEQANAVQALLEMVADEYEDEENEEGEGEGMKQNVFNNDKNANNNDVLKHSINESLVEAARTGASSWKQVMNATIDDDTLKHGINSIEMLFPEAMQSTNGNTPIVYKDPNTAYAKILAGFHKSPFSRVKTLVADLTEDEARAKGYIKGNMKKEQFFSLIKRVTTPTTVYKKQKIDRDDLVDITDFNVVAFMNTEMRMMLEEEIARAAIVGDGRDIASDDKISETNIRPIITDNEFFTIQKKYTDAANFIEVVTLAMAEYRGSGVPSMYIDSTLLASIKLLKGTDGRFLFGQIPSTAAIADMLGVKEIITTTFMPAGGALIVNLSDYSLGAVKGGEITNFDAFDIDFNQHKYLTETRLSGALTMPKSAINFNTTTVVGADDTKGGLTYGTRQPVTP